MTRILWDQAGERLYETGIDRGVLYHADSSGEYTQGFGWNGLTAVTESPSGAEATPLYADNIKYVSLTSAEEFGGTIEAFTYPEEFGVNDGTASPTPGVYVGQQTRKPFGLAYRSLIGNDLEFNDHGYKLNLVYGAQAAPSEKARTTVNDSPEAVTFSWEFTTTPVEVTGLKPTAILTIDSTKVDADALADLEDALYGTAGQEPRLPSPDEVLAFFTGTVTDVETQAPTYNASTDIVTIPSVTGVVYWVDGEVVTGTVGPITEDTVVTATPAPGYRFTPTSDRDWTINFA